MQVSKKYSIHSHHIYVKLKHSVIICLCDIYMGSEMQLINITAAVVKVEQTGTSVA